MQRTALDGATELVKAAGTPWRGTEAQARERARVLGEEDPSARYEAQRG